MAKRKRLKSRRVTRPRAGKSSAILLRYIIIVPCLLLLVVAGGLFVTSGKGSTVLGVATASFRSEAVYWQSVSGAVGYNIYYKQQSDNTYTHAVRNLPSNSASYTINYLRKNQTYQYVVKAIDASGKEFWSSEPRWILSVK